MVLDPVIFPLRKSFKQRSKVSYITNGMLDIFAVGGHQNYAKAARLYVQMILKYGEGSHGTTDRN